MIDDRTSRLLGALSSTATRARVTVGVYVLIAAAIAAACDVHGLSAPGSLASITVTPPFAGIGVSGALTLVDNATLLGRALARNGAVSLGTNNTITLQ